MVYFIEVEVLTMDTKEIIKKSIWIAMEYYEKNNIELFFENMSKNVMWHGIAIGQKIQGLDNLRQVWSTFSNSLTFTLGNIEAECIQTSSKTCEVMMMYVVTVHYPNGDTVPAFQRAQFSWAEVSYIDEKGKRKRLPKIFMVHLSNPIEYHEDDYVYPDHYNELYIKAEAPVQEPRISLLGTDGVFYVITLNSVIWIESTPEHQCILHLRDRTLRVRINLSNLEKQTVGYLIRIHSSYIVNPLDVKSVWRFNVELSDGTVVPIPEKKYTAMKKNLLKNNAQG